MCGEQATNATGCAMMMWEGKKVKKYTVNQFYDLTTGGWSAISTTSPPQE
jgi:hypothetical protein